MHGDYQQCFYQVTTREDVQRYRSGEVGDIVQRIGFGINRFTSIQRLSDGLLEVRTDVDEERRQEIQHGIIPGTLTADEKEEIFIITHAFVSREEAAPHAIQLIEEEITRLREKQKALRTE